MNNAERTKYSPVICWQSAWRKDNKLNITKMNRESMNYQKALDRLAQEQTWKR